MPWALEAFDLLYAEFGDSKWLDAYNATANTIATVYDIDDGRGWFKKAKGNAFILPGTYLANTRENFSQANITRNADFGLDFSLSASEKASEMQFGRGITDVIKATDTHISVRAKSRLDGAQITIFLQDVDDDLVAAHRWLYVLTLSNTMTTYDIALSSFEEKAYPFTSDEPVLGNGFSVGQQLKVAGFIYYDTAAEYITLESLRPTPQIQLPYTPSVAPYTANSVSGQILDWAGGPGIGYQNAWIWAELGDATKRGVMVGFLQDSQNEYNSRYGGTLGPFVPAYIWDRYDVLEIGGTPGTWDWLWPDPNSEWVGYTARCVSGLARCAYVATDATARTVAGNFLNWLNTNWTDISHYIPTNYPESVPARANSTAVALNETMDGFNGFMYRADVAGTTAATPPTLPTTIGATVVDGTVTWRCAGYMYGSQPIYGEYHEPHAAALFMRAAAYYKLAGGTAATADALVLRCWNYLESLFNTTGSMTGTWSHNPSQEEWWGFWGAEIILTLSLMTTELDAVRSANGISATTINERIASYDTWLTSVTRTVALADFDDVVADDDASIERTQDAELPAEVIVQYENQNNSGEPESKYARKQSGFSDVSTVVRLNMAISGNKAQEIAYKKLAVAWSERTNWKFEWANRLVQPGDALEFDVEGNHVKLFVRGVNYDSHGRATIDAVSYDSTAYRLSAPAGSEVVNSITLSLPPVSYATIFDLPAISDSDNEPGYSAGVYAGSGYWSGAALTVSDDGGASYAAEIGFTVQMTRGTVAEQMQPIRTTVIDRFSVLTVTLEYGQLESITESQLLLGQNLALIGNEIVNFQTATLIAQNTYELSGFLRGQRGTEDQIYTHAVTGDQFVLLNGAIERASINPALIGVQRDGRLFTAGRTTDDAVDFTFSANCLHLLPWAPVWIKGWREGDGALNLYWTRRARVNNKWLDNSDVPIGETTEQYRVDFLTNPLYLSGTIISSVYFSVDGGVISASTINSFYGDPHATVHVAIRQISSVMGAGKPLEGTF